MAWSDGKKLELTYLVPDRRTLRLQEVAIVVLGPRSLDAVDSDFQCPWITLRQKDNTVRDRSLSLVNQTTFIPIPRCTGLALVFIEFLVVGGREKKYTILPRLYDDSRSGSGLVGVKGPSSIYLRNFSVAPSSTIDLDLKKRPRLFPSIIPSFPRHRKYEASGKSTILPRPILSVQLSEASVKIP
ncbi:hypothetical protein BDN72DRAFT_925125 [Pluteus cervinus]|uniref:Uncharacterized protein n=1 Tax=Pluteus cervinus TaxID=181527 RepID=A0ACD3AGG4_9AGAR|nr:hypothetical protein BDN72DRAFT_925125 [Pluteus cervinus]